MYIDFTVILWYPQPQGIEHVVSIKPLYKDFTVILWHTQGT